jgi:hypothetical protein
MAYDTSNVDVIMFLEVLLVHDMQVDYENSKGFFSFAKQL